MDDEPRCTAIVDVLGENYDELVRKARANAVALLGPDRPYYLILHDVRREIEIRTPEGQVTSAGGWVAQARIVYPHEPMF